MWIMNSIALMAGPWNNAILFSLGSPYSHLYFGASFFQRRHRRIRFTAPPVRSLLYRVAHSGVRFIAPNALERHIAIGIAIGMFYIARSWLLHLLRIPLLCIRIGCFSSLCAWSWWVFSRSARSIFCICFAWCILACNFHIRPDLLCSCRCTLCIHWSSFQVLLVLPGSCSRFSQLV